MSERIFAEAAPRLWAAGLPAHPVNGKRAIVRGWTAYCRRLPDEETQRAWLAEFASCNVGVCLGPQSGLVVIDIDTNDEKVIGILSRHLPPTPWRRVGSKGAMWLYAYTPATKGFAVDDENGKRLFELLGDGRQMVAPPSIHPETHRAYFANVDLVDLVATRRHEIRPLPAEIEAILRDALERGDVKLKAKGRSGGAGGGIACTNFVSSGSRDSTMVSVAGLHARDVISGMRTLLEAIGCMREWVQNFTEQVWGDPIDPEKAVERLIHFLIRDVTGARKATLPSGWDAGLTPEMKTQLGLDILTEDCVKWTAKEITDWFLAEIGRPGVAENPDLLRDLTEKVAQKIAANPGLGRIGEAQIIQFISEASGKTFSVAALRGYIKDLRKEEISGEDHTELALCMLKELTKTGEVRFDQGSLWRWQGSHWGKIDDNDVMKQIGELYGKYPLGKRASDHAAILKLLKVHASAPLKTVDIEGVNYVNGFLTIDLQLIPPSPDYGVTYCMPYPYLPELADKCPKWLGMLNTMWGDDPDCAAKIRMLQEAMGVTLMGVAPRYERGFCLYGVPHSGKTQILEVLKRLMPPECVSYVSPHEFGDKFAPAQMAGKLLNVAGEISETELIDGKMFKQIIDGTEISAQHKNQPIFSFTPKCAQWIAGNFLPRSRDSSEGFTRRLLFFEFRKAFPNVEGVKVPQYWQVLIGEEREAISAWAVEGIIGLKQQLWHYTEPASHRECEERVAERNNNVRYFIRVNHQKGRLRVGDREHQGLTVVTTALEDLYSTYQTFCRCVGHVLPVGLEEFYNRLVGLKEVFGIQALKEPRGQFIKYITVVEQKATLRSVA